MKTKILAAMFGAMLMVSAIGGTAFAARGGVPGPDAGNQGGNDRVTICHNDKTIDVSEKAVDTHVEKHDDTLGACPP